MKRDSMSPDEESGSGSRIHADTKSVLYVHGKGGKAFIYKSDGNVENVSIAVAIIMMRTAMRFLSFFF